MAVRMVSTGAPEGLSVLRERSYLYDGWARRRMEADRFAEKPYPCGGWPWRVTTKKRAEKPRLDCSTSLAYDRPEAAG